MALANEARYVMRTLQAHLTLFCLSLPLGACALVGIDPDEIDVFDEAADEAGDTGGETANDAGGTEGGETGTEGTTADTAASSDTTTGDPTTGDPSDTSTDGGTTDEGTTGPGACEPAEQDTLCVMCLKDACCELYDACLFDANCACNLECLDGMCECEPPGEAYALLDECIASSCADAC